MTVATASLTFVGSFATSAAAVTFIGKDVPTTVKLQPGSTGAVPWTYQNTGGAGTLPAAGMKMVFTAPGNTTFPAQASVPTEYSGDGAGWGANNVGLRNCALSNGNKTLTCEGYGRNGGVSGWPANGYFRFSPQVTVDASAPSNTTLAKGNGSFGYTDPNNGTDYTITDGTLNVATPAKPGMCLDAGNTRANGDGVRIWECLDHTNQRWVIDGGKVKVADTVGSAKEMCLDVPARSNSTRLRLWECVSTPNQNWVVRGGAFVVADTLASGNEMCMDVGNGRNNGDAVILYQCGATNNNQKFVVDRGYIKVKDTI